MTGYIIVRQFGRPLFLTPQNGWSRKLDNALLFPTEQAALKRLGDKTGDVKPITDFIKRAA